MVRVVERLNDVLHCHRVTVEAELQVVYRVRRLPRMLYEDAVSVSLGYLNEPREATEDLIWLAVKEPNKHGPRLTLHLHVVDVARKLLRTLRCAMLLAGVLLDKDARAGTLAIDSNSLAARFPPFHIDVTCYIDGRVFWDVCSIAYAVIHPPLRSSLKAYLGPPVDVSACSTPVW